MSPAIAVCLFSIAAQAQHEQMPVFGTTVVLPSGLHGSVYHIRRNTQRLPDLQRRKPVGTIYTTSLDIPPQDFKQGFPGVTDRFEWFAIEYTGRFWIQKPALYHFSLTSDDGSRLYIDDELVVDNDRQHPPETREASRRLAGGIHHLRLDYFQGPRFHIALQLLIAGPGEKLRPFSTDEFKPPPNPETWEYPDSPESPQPGSAKHDATKRRSQ